MSLLKRFEAAEAQEQSLIEFVRWNWATLEPDRPLVEGWALDAICEHLEAVTRGEIPRLLINVPPGFMKPVWEEEPVITGRGVVPLRDVVVGDTVLTHRGRYRTVLDVQAQGDLPVVAVRLRSGRTVRAAPDHPFLTPRGWVPAGALDVGEYVAAVFEQDDARTDSVTAEEARLIGYLVGDGSLTHSPTFTNANEDVLSDFAVCAASLGFSTRFRRPKKSRAAVIGLRGAQDWLKRHGLFGKSSYTKRIPAGVLASSRAIVREFIGAYWSCDGCVHVRTDGNKTAVKSFATTVGLDLAKDVQMACLLAGISTVIRTKTRALPSKRQGDNYTSYSVAAFDQDNVAKFGDLVSLCLAKRDIARQCRRRDFDRVLEPDQVVGVEQDGVAPCRCLRVDEDASFTAGGIAVHNSLLVNVFHPAWEWGPGGRPGMRYVNFSYSSSLTERDNNRFRDLMLDGRYSDLWKDRFTLRKIGETKVTNDKTGWKLASSVGGVATGERGDRIILDDPHNVKEGESETVRSETVRWFRESMSNRLNNMDEGSIVVIMQRVHDADVSGVIIGDGLGYEHLCIPMEYDSRRPCITGIGWQDPREDDGDLAWPERFSRDVVSRLQTTLGSYAYSSQYQQYPVPRGGGIIKDSYWRLYPPEGERFDETGEPLAPLQYPPMDYVLVSVDTALTAKEENCWSACTVWGVYRNDKDLIKVLLMHAWQARDEFHDLVERIILTGRGMEKRIRRDGSSYEVSLGWHADAVLIENKANGLSVVQEIGRLVRGEEFALKTFDPRRDGGGDIVARAHSVEAMFEAGLVHAPDRDWANMVIDEVSAVPKGAHDDLASSAFQALKWLRDRNLLLMRSERESQLARELSPKNMRPMGKPYDV